MADTAIAVTAGSGTNIDARSESTNGDLRQVIVIGDPSTNAGVAPVDGTAGLKVNLGSDNDVTNAGTFAVQVDGDALTALQILDDWDETDRAKVNLIAGQAGITAGAGVVAANTPRVTHASNDPAVTALQIMDDWDESDRAKVNLIAGQAGITAGAGVVATNTPRATLASDDPAVTALQVIDDWDESDRAKVNPVVGQAGLAAGTGVDAVNALRVSLATDIALPAGTNAIGKLAANTGVDIGDVDVTSLVPGTAATNLGKAEDAAHTTGDVGIEMLAVRRDAKAVGAGTDGDYATLNVNAGGDLRVDGGQVHVFESAPTISASAYASGDVFGGEIEITNAARVSGGGGLITDVVMAVEDDGSADFAANKIELWFFKSNPAGTYTDNAALAVSDADAFEVERVVTLDEYYDGGNVTILSAANLNIGYNCDATSLWAVPVIRAAITPDATDAVQFRFKLIRD